MKNNFIKRILSIFVLSPIFILCVIKGGIIFNIFLFVLLLIIIFEIKNLNLLYTQIILSLLLLLFLYSFYSIRNKTNGLEIIFLLTFITWLSDIGGYIFGKLIGGKKINFISPNKTFSGYCGSIILAQLNLLFIDFVNLNLFTNIYSNIIFLFCCTVLVIFGDLLFSYVKRLNKIKDYSNVIPGHGGLLDRLDGFIVLVTIFNIVYHTL